MIIQPVKMKNQSIQKAANKQESDRLHGETKTDNISQNPVTNLSYMEVEKELNSKILKITLKINDHYPELSKYLEEMPATVPVDNEPEMTLKNLSAYYESLKVLMDKYINEHPQKLES